MFGLWCLWFWSLMAGYRTYVLVKVVTDGTEFEEALSYVALLDGVDKTKFQGSLKFTASSNQIPHRFNSPLLPRFQSRKNGGP